LWVPGAKNRRVRARPEDLIRPNTNFEFCDTKIIGSKIKGSQKLYNIGIFDQALRQGGYAEVPYSCPQLPPSQLANEDRIGYPAASLGGLEMPERDKVGERLSTMLQQAAASAEGRTEVTLRNPQDEATKALREAIEVQKKAAEAETRAAEASIT